MHLKNKENKEIKGGKKKTSTKETVHLTAFDLSFPLSHHLLLQYVQAFPSHWNVSEPSMTYNQNFEATLEPPSFSQPQLAGKARWLASVFSQICATPPDISTQQFTCRIDEATTVRAGFPVCVHVLCWDDRGEEAGEQEG